MSADNSARKKIRHTIAKLLARQQPDEPGAWALVYQSRLDYPRNVWPYLKIYATNDDITPATVHSPYIQERDLTLQIVGMIRVNAGEHEAAENTMDDLAALVEKTLTNDAVYAELQEIKFIALQSTALDALIGTDDTISQMEVTQTWRIRYMTLEGSPEALI